jgi:hypothetical protein
MRDKVWQEDEEEQEHGTFSHMMWNPAMLLRPMRARYHRVSNGRLRSMLICRVHFKIRYIQGRKRAHACKDTSAPFAVWPSASRA